jgi:PIN domain nuclease of toxin-antitoxin system
VKVLTDTHSLVWALSKPELLSNHARQVLSESEVTASVVNLWELVLKMHKEGALLADPVKWWGKYISGNGIPSLSIQTTHIETLGSLALLHKDPFDRILVAQAIVEELPLVTKDASLGLYGISVIW